MFMCVVNRKAVNKLDLTWKQSFLVFVEKPRLPSFPNPDIQRLHYGKSTAAECYQLLQKIRFWAKNIASDNSAKIKDILIKVPFHTI